MITTTTAIAIPALRIGSRATLQFYVDAFGAKVVFVTPESGDEVHHAELTIGGAMFMCGTGQENGVEQEPGGSSSYWVVDDVDTIDALYAQAIAAGAVGERAPYDADYGGRHFTVRDPDGNLWSFGTYRPAGI
ncbi:MAG: glyoxalase [Solirubrobacterales bacterium]|nr:glyoxalase [Solirubrobacterales bacterium]